MRKETAAALFVFLLLLSTFGATVSAFDWRRGEEPDLPPDIEPYLVTIDETYMENWGGKPAYYKGIYVINLTAEYVEISSMYLSKFGLTISNFSGSNLVMYVTEARVQLAPGLIITITPEDIEDPEVQPPPPPNYGYGSNIAFDLIYMEASGVTVSGFASVTYPDEVTLKSKRVVLSGYDIVADEYEGTEVTKTTAEELTIKDSSMIIADDYTYTFNAPVTVMENAEVYTTYVKGLGLGFIPLKWSGANIPWLVRLVKMLFSKMPMTGATLHTVSLSAESTTMSTIKLDISA